MTLESWLKFKGALDQAGITKYQIDTDTDYHLFNDTDAGKVIVLDEGSSTFYNFRWLERSNSSNWLYS